MKTQLNKLRWLLIVLLFAGVTGAMAENSDPTQTVCIGNEPYRVDLNAISGATYAWSITPGTPGVDWQINVLPGAGNEITVDWLVPNVYTLEVITTANGCPGLPQNVVVTVNPLLPVSVIIATTDPTTVCEGVAVNFTTAVTNGGASPTYQWFDGGVLIPGATNSTYTYIGALPGASITCEVSTTAPCTSGSPALSNAIPVTVNATLPLSVLISTTDPTTICEGSTVTFIAAVTNGGASPTYQWYADGTLIPGANLSNYTYTGVVPGASITCVVSSTETCITGSPATSNAIPVIVNPIPVTTPIFHN
ncbi:MAG: hypothetical protein NTW16_05665 [Bacteroidetes bacterium]|nr:hypothetical protein [Bacteroidota bacterium]